MIGWICTVYAKPGNRKKKRLEELHCNLTSNGVAGFSSVNVNIVYLPMIGPGLHVTSNTVVAGGGLKGLHVSTQRVFSGKWL